MDTRLFAELMSEHISTHYERHKSWHRNAVSIIRWAVLLAPTRVDAVLALMQTDQTIVTTAAADGLLPERG